jgi:hypothetical protein
MVRSANFAGSSEASMLSVLANRSFSACGGAFRFVGTPWWTHSDSGGATSNSASMTEVSAKQALS